MKRLCLFLVLFCLVSFPGFSQTIHNGPHDPTALHEDGSNIAKFLTFDITPGAIAYEAGKLFYDVNEGCLSFMPMFDGPILQIGQELWIWGYNNSGSTIVDGSVVYLSGATGSIPEVDLAQANTVVTSRMIGVATMDIANGAFGFITTRGKLRGIDTSSYSTGDPLYLSESVAGGLTDTVPTTGYVVKVGTVISSNATTGSIHVFPTVQGALGPAVFADDVKIQGQALIKTPILASDWTVATESALFDAENDFYFINKAMTLQGDAGSLATYTSGPAHGEGSSAFIGACLAPNGKVILAPCGSSNIGIYDPVANTYTSGPTHGEGSDAFMGACLAPNGKVIFAPRSSSNVGIYDGLFGSIATSTLLHPFLNKF